MIAFPVEQMNCTQRFLVKIMGHADARSKTDFMSAAKAVYHVIKHVQHAQVQTVTNAQAADQTS